MINLDKNLSFIHHTRDSHALTGRVGQEITDTPEASSGEISAELWKASLSLGWMNTWVLNKLFSYALIKSHLADLHIRAIESLVFLWKPAREIMEAKSLIYLKIIPINRYSLSCVYLFCAACLFPFSHVFMDIFSLHRQKLSIFGDEAEIQRRKERERQKERESAGADRSVSSFRSRGQLWSAYSSATWAKKAPNLNRGPNNCVIE